MSYYILREFASANERHLDSSALGRWIPRPARRQNSPKNAKPRNSTIDKSIVQKVGFSCRRDAHLAQNAWKKHVFFQYLLKFHKKSKIQTNLQNWRHLGRSWVHLGRSWGHLGRSGHQLGPSWRQFGRSWCQHGRSWRQFGRSWRQLGPSWPILAPTWPIRPPADRRPPEDMYTNSRSTAFAAPY